MSEVVPSQENEVNEEMNHLIETQGRIDTVEEMDENTQAIYRNDLMYLFFKILLFLFLGGVFYFLFKDQSPTEIVSLIKEKASNVTKIVKEKIESVSNSTKDISSKDIVKV